MNNKFRVVIKNIFSMIFANGISFIISALITLIIPKILNVENYSYVQLYIFYTSYVSYLHYGWVDGIRLRYGGIFYDNIDKSVFKSQIVLYNLVQFVISTIVIIVIILLGFNGNRQIAFLAVGICMMIRLPRIMPQYILEMSNRITECARITIIEKVSYLIITIIILITGKASVLSLLIADLIGQLLSCIYAFYCCRDILKSKPDNINNAVKEIKKNIFSGIKLTIANISSLLIIGIVRQFIEFKWDVTTFGKLSLTISISNLLMLFIRAISMVMFPTLRRVDKEKLSEIYSLMRIGIMIPLLGMLILYSPLKMIISSWLPQYSDSLKYMAILFPMCIFESKMCLLIETYLKTLRLEGWLLKINIITLFLSFFTTILTTCVLHNLTLAVLSIVLLLAFRCVFAEKILATRINIDFTKHSIYELSLVAIFILSSWYIGGIKGLIIYLLFYVIYLYLIRNNIKQLIIFLKKGLKKNEN